MENKSTIMGISNLPKKVRYDSFNGLRAIAALGIAIMHYRAFIAVKPNENFFTSSCIPFFTEFVFLFFMVSAFGMCCGYFDKFTINPETKASAFNTNSFYTKRFSRIWPYFALLVTIDLIMYVVQHGITFDCGLRGELYMALADYTMCFNFLPNPAITVIGGGWFLGTIFVFYIMFPFFVFLLNSKKRAWFAMFVALMMHLLTVHYFLTPEFCLQSQIENARHEITYSFIFLFSGGILFLYKDSLYKENILFKAVLLALVVAGTIAQLVWHPSILGENRLYQLILFAIWIVYAMNGGFAVKGIKFLDNKVMKFLGDLSMEIYLTHMMMLRLLEKIHLKQHIQDVDLLFVITYICGIALSIGFAWSVKNILFPTILTLYRKRIGV